MDLTFDEVVLLAMQRSTDPKNQSDSVRKPRVIVSDLSSTNGAEAGSSSTKTPSTNPSAQTSSDAQKNAQTSEKAAANGPNSGRRDSNTSAAIKSFVAARFSHRTKNTFLPLLLELGAANPKVSFGNL